MDEAFKGAFASAKHIASFVTAEMHCDIPGMRHAARRGYESAQSKFPQMETFTAISLNGIPSMAWAVFKKEWQLQAGRGDARTEGTSPPRLVLLLQDQSLWDSWVILDRRKRHLELKKSWEAEEDRLKRQGKREERVTRAQTARKNLEAETIRTYRRLFLVARLGEQLGTAEESIEWELEVNWWGERKREERLYSPDGAWLGV